MVISHNGLKALLITLKLLLVIFAIEVITLYEIFFITLLSFHVHNVKRVKFENEVCDLATGRFGAVLSWYCVDVSVAALHTTYERYEYLFERNVNT